MTLSITTLQQYAKTRKTTVIAHKIASDYKSATFVLESGPKLTMTEDEIKAAIEEYDNAKKLEEAIEAVKNQAAESEADRKKRLKEEAKAKKEAEAKAKAE